MNWLFAVMCVPVCNKLGMCEYVHGHGFDFITIQSGLAWSLIINSEELMMREAAAPRRPITHQPLTACRGLSCSMCCACLCLRVWVAVRTQWVLMRGNIYDGISAIISHMILFIAIYPEPYQYMHYYLSGCLTFVGLWTQKTEFIIIQFYYAGARHKVQ